MCQICASPKPPLSHQVTHKLEDQRRNNRPRDLSSSDPKRQDHDQETASNIRRTRDQSRNSRSWERSRSDSRCQDHDQETVTSIRRTRNQRRNSRSRDRSRSMPKCQDHVQETAPNIRSTRGKFTNYATLNSALICCATSLQHLEHKRTGKGTRKQQSNPIDNTPDKYANSSWSKFLQVYYCFHINRRFEKYRPQKACRSVACESGFLYFPDSQILKILIYSKPHNTTTINLSYISW